MSGFFVTPPVNGYTITHFHFEISDWIMLLLAPQLRPIVLQHRLVHSATNTQEIIFLLIYMKVSPPNIFSFRIGQQPQQNQWKR